MFSVPQVFIVWPLCFSLYQIKNMREGEKLRKKQLISGNVEEGDKINEGKSILEKVIRC